MLRRFDWINGCGIFEDFRWDPGLRDLARIIGFVEELGTDVRGAVQLTGEYDDGTPLNLLVSNCALSSLCLFF